MDPSYVPLFAALCNLPIGLAYYRGLAEDLHRFRIYGDQIRYNFFPPQSGKMLYRSILRGFRFFQPLCAIELVIASNSNKD
jgi:hypothetical protein